MATYGYGGITDRGFVSFEPELEEAPWKDIITKKYDNASKENASAFLGAGQLIVWKLHLQSGIAAVLTALGAAPLTPLDQAWDGAQRRLFHRIAVHIDDEDPVMRACADRLAAQLLAGTGTAQTGFEFDDEVDFGRKQIRLTGEGGALAADAKKLKIGDVLADVAKTTEALAKGLGRTSGGARKAPSRKIRDAVAECAATFNLVHESIAWFVARTPAGAERDHLTALLAPLERLLERHLVVAVAPAPEKESKPEPDAKAEEKPVAKADEKSDVKPEKKPG